MFLFFSKVTHSNQTSHPFPWYCTCKVAQYNIQVNDYVYNDISWKSATEQIFWHEINEQTIMYAHPHQHFTWFSNNTSFNDINHIVQFMPMKYTKHTIRCNNNRIKPYTDKEYLECFLIPIVHTH